MKLMVLILNKLEALEYLLEGMSAAGIGGATIIESSGMAMTLSKLDSSFVSASILSLFSATSNEDNRTSISVIRNDQLETARKVIYSTVGDLSMPNTGILFTLPIDFAEGIRKNRGSIMNVEEANEVPEMDTSAASETEASTPADAPAEDSGAEAPGRNKKKGKG